MGLHHTALAGRIERRSFAELQEFGSTMEASIPGHIAMLTFLHNVRAQLKVCPRLPL